MKTRLITLAYAFAFSYLGSKATLMLVYGGIETRSVDWSFPAGTGLARWSLIMFTVLGLAAALSYAGARMGFLVARRSERVIVRGFGSSVTGAVIAMVGACLLISIIGGFWPVAGFSWTPLLNLVWGPHGFALDLPVYMGFLLTVPSVFSTRSLQDELNRSNVVHAHSLNDVARLMTVQDGHPCDEVRYAATDRLCTLIRGGDLRDEKRLAKLAAHPDKRIRRLVAEALPEGFQLLVEELVRKEKEGGVRKVLFSKIRDWRLLRDYHREEPLEAVKEAIEGFLVGRAKGQLNPDEAQALVLAEDAPYALQAYAYTQVGVSFLLERLTMRSEEDNHAVITKALEDRSEGGLSEEEASLIARCKALSMKIRKRAFEALSRQSLERIAREPDAESAVAAVQHLPASAEKVFFELAMDPTVPIEARLIALGRIKDNEMLARVGIDATDSTLRKAAQEGLFSAVWQREFVLESQHPDERIAMISRIRDLDLLLELAEDPRLSREEQSAALALTLSPESEVTDGPSKAEGSLETTSRSAAGEGHRHKDWNSFAAALMSDAENEESCIAEICLCCGDEETAEALAACCPENVIDHLDRDPWVEVLASGQSVVRYAAKGPDALVLMMGGIASGHYGASRLVIKGGMAVGLPLEEQGEFLKGIGVKDAVSTSRTLAW